MDVKTGFLNGELNENIYMKQPEGFVEPGKEELVCKLKRSIYGLKQSARCWNAELDAQLKKLGFIQSTGDPCIYIKSSGELFIIAVYVDDLILAGENEETYKKLSKRFQKNLM